MHLHIKLPFCFSTLTFNDHEDLIVVTIVNFALVDSFVKGVLVKSC